MSLASERTSGDGMPKDGQELIDPQGRRLDYLRLAVTDRCNLRCFYCMPEEGINYVPRKELLTYEELLLLVNVLAHIGEFERDCH